mmetsp:Transcript_13179/g.16535  ORF Transcript_13179/g.16535 Transcript_13179/m.16535 type:complete len:150 (-) Transcript_13179:29-478(-)
MYHSPGVSLVSNRLMSSKPISCFLIYCEEKRDSLKRPDRSNSEVTSILGAQWRALDTKTKDTYRAEAHRRKKEYKKKHPFPEKRKPKLQDRYISTFKINKNTETEVPFSFPRSTLHSHNLPPYDCLAFVDNHFYVFLENWFGVALNKDQ